MKTEAKTNDTVKEEIKKMQYDYFIRKLRKVAMSEKDKFDIDEFIRYEVIDCDEIPEDSKLVQVIRNEYEKMSKEGKKNMKKANKKKMSKETEAKIEALTAEILEGVKSEAQHNGFYFDFCKYVRSRTDNLEESLRRAVIFNVINETAKIKKSAGGLNPTAYEAPNGRTERCVECGAQVREYYMSDNFRKLCEDCVSEYYPVCENCGKIYKHGGVDNFSGNLFVHICNDCAKKLRLN